MRTPDPPAVPDPIKTAAAQGAANKETAVAQYGLQATNQVTPSGNLTYSNIGTWPDGTPRFQAEQTLSPGQQQLFATNQATQQGLSNLANTETGKISEHLSTPFNADGLPQAGVTPGTAPGLMGSYGVERASGQIGDAGGIQRSVPQADQSGQIADVGGVLRSYGPTDFSNDRTKVENALYSRLNPQLERDRSSLDTRLINAGVRPGTAAYDRQMDTFNRGSNDARMQAVLAGGGEQSRLAGLAKDSASFFNTGQMQEFQQAGARTAALDAAVEANNAARMREATFGRESQGQQFTQNVARTQSADAAALANTDANKTAAQFANQAGQQTFTNQQAIAAAQDNARQRALQERLTFRNQPIQEVSALMSGSQVQQPNFVNAPTPGVAPTDLIGATANATNANMNVYNQQLASQNAMMGGLFGLAGNAAKAYALSDVRAKTDIKRVGRMDTGLPIYSYAYKADPDRRVQLGLMAQDVETVLPEAVAETDTGVKMVNYSAVAEALA